jgi:hypothetical protein
MHAQLQAAPPPHPNSAHHDLSRLTQKPARLCSPRESGQGLNDQVNISVHDYVPGSVNIEKVSQRVNVTNQRCIRR